MVLWDCGMFFVPQGHKSEVLKDKISSWLLSTPHRYLVIAEKLEEIKSFRELTRLDLSCCKLGDEHELLEHLTNEALSRYQPAVALNNCFIFKRMSQWDHLKECNLVSCVYLIIVFLKSFEPLFTWYSNIDWITLRIDLFFFFWLTFTSPVVIETIRTKKCCSIFVHF